MISEENKERNDLQLAIINSNSVSDYKLIKEAYKRLRENNQLTAYEAYICLHGQLMDVLYNDLCGLE